MTLTAQNAMSYQAASKINKPTKQGIRIISEMSTTRILTYVAYRHRVGLLMASTAGLLAYVAWDKIISLFI